MISWHKPGQKVVCKELLDYTIANPQDKLPIPGEIYTIRGVYPGNALMHKEYVFFTLEEIVNEKRFEFPPHEVRFVSLVFSPIYPTAIENLKKLTNIPLDARIKFERELQEYEEKVHVNSPSIFHNDEPEYEKGHA